MKRPVVLAPSRAVAHRRRRIVLVWVDARQEREFRRLIAVGDAALASGQTFDAIEAFSGALALKPESMLASLKRGDTYRRRGEYAAALRDLGQAAFLDPAAPRPIELLGDVQTALGPVRRRGRRVPALPGARRSRAGRPLQAGPRPLSQRHRPARAVDPLRRAVALDDRFAEAHYLLGLSLRETRSRNRRCARLRRALEINATFAAAREELARVYEQMGRWQDAIDQLEALAALEPARAERLVNVGLAYARIGRRDTAVLTLGRAAERHPERDRRLHRARPDLARRPPKRSRIQSHSEKRSRRCSLRRHRPTPPARRVRSTAARWRSPATSSPPSACCCRRSRRMPVDPLAYRYLAEVARRLGHIERARRGAAAELRASLAPSA